MAAAPVSSLICDTVIVAVNLFFIARYAPTMLPSLRTGLVLLGLPTLLSSGAVVMTKLMRGWLGWQEVTPLHTIGTVACVACLYGAGLLIGYLLREPLKIHRTKNRRNLFRHTSQ